MYRYLSVGIAARVIGLGISCSSESEESDFRCRFDILRRTFVVVEFELPIGGEAGGFSQAYIVSE